MELEEYIKNHPEFNKLRKDFTKFLKKKNLEYSLDFSDCRFEKDGIHFEVKIYTKKKEKNKKKLLKMTWREFLENYDFSNWELGFINMNVDKMYDNKCIIKKFNTKDILYNSNIHIDFEKHIIDTGILTEIIDFENVIDFYIVFSWDYKKMSYVTWCKCFFTLGEAEKFVKGDII